MIFKDSFEKCWKGWSEYIINGEHIKKHKVFVTASSQLAHHLDPRATKNLWAVVFLRKKERKKKERKTKERKKEIDQVLAER